VRDVPLRIDITTEQATDVWLSRYPSVNTRSAYASDLRAFLSWLGDDSSVLDVTPEAISEYRADRQSSGVSEATVNRQFSALRAFYATVAELGACGDNPFGTRLEAVTQSSSTGILDAGDVTRLEAAAALDPRTAALVQLLLGEGMRLAEVLALDHADVSGPRHAKRLRVVRHGQSMSVGLDRTGSRSVHALARTTRAPGPLFLGPARGRAGATRLTRFGADHLIKQAAAAAGIEQPVSANVLRRTHVTNADRGGVAIDDIRQTMGHLDVRTTRRYLDRADAEQTTTEAERS
jgi:integrase/recombinase XerD